MADCWSCFRLSDAGASGFEPLFNCANAVLAQLVHEQVIGVDERKRMVLGAYPRRRVHLEPPSNADGQFHALSVERRELLTCLTRLGLTTNGIEMWTLLLGRHAAFFRAIFVPSLASAVGDAGEGVKHSPTPWNRN